MTSTAPTPQLDRRVWVDLDILYGASQDGETHADQPVDRSDRLVISGRAPGLLRRWVRDSHCRWFGVVDFSVLFGTGAVALRMEATLVPADALAPIPIEPRR